MVTTLKGLAGGISDIYKKIARMIDQDAQRNDVRRYAVGLMGEDEKYYIKTAANAERIYINIRDNIVYVDDIDGIETLQDAVVTLENKFGDCDDLVEVQGALWRSIGYPVALVLVQLNGFSDYNHIYLAVLTDDGWRISDATNKNGIFGWETPFTTYTRRKVVFLGPRENFTDDAIAPLLDEKTVTPEFYDASTGSFWPLALLAGAAYAIYHFFIK